MHPIYYISQGTTIADHLSNIKLVCEAGCRFVQLRIKDVDMMTLIPAAEAAQAICERYGAQLIINDHIEVAKNVNAAGVHLGLQDATPAEARIQLGENAIIGGTANTLDDCLAHIKAGVTYIGLGPFRFTQTKEQLSPVLGIAGYHDLMTALHRLQHRIPVYAIGGITGEDVEALMQTGIYGVAVSGILSGLKPDDVQSRWDRLSQRTIVPIIKDTL